MSTAPTTNPEQTTEPGSIATAELRELLDLTLQQTATKRRIDLLRDLVAREAQQTLTTTGAAPSWKIRGLGAIRYDTPDPDKPTVYVQDPAALATWAAEHQPTEVVATITLDGTMLEAAVEALRFAGVPIQEATATVRDGAAERLMRDAILTNVAADGDDPDWLVTLDDGTVIDGLGTKASGPAKLVVTPDSAAKAALTASVDQAWLATHPSEEG